MQFPVKAKLKDGTPVELVLAENDDVAAVQDLYRVIVEEGTSYPHQHPLDREGVLDYWFRGKTTIVAYSTEDPRAEGLLGAFYLKPNWPGRARKVANAGFIVAPAWRNKGLGWLLGATMLDYARSLGYHSVIFNLVFSQNPVAKALWVKLGFSDLGVIPRAVENADGTYQDAVIMFCSLK